MKVEKQYNGKNYTIFEGDSCQVIKALPDNSVHFNIHSPPFSALYIYSDSISDMGNCKDDEEFFRHYEFLIPEMYRILKPGRLCAIHCKDLVDYKGSSGKAGLRDFSGQIIMAMERHGFKYHSRVTIWKDPVIEMQRTKAQGLLHKSIRADSTICRQGLPDYLIVFRKWPEDGETSGDEPVSRGNGFKDYVGENAPVFRTEKEACQGETIDDIEQGNSIQVWQRYASPVWFDINQTRVLNTTLARNEDDEKHLCLARGSLVLTSEGYKPIQDVCVGDLVLTHKGRWRPVMVVKKTGFKPVITVKAQGVPGLTLTPDHKLWSRIVPENAWSQAHSKAAAKKIEPSWNEAQKTLGSYINQKTLPEIKLDINDSELWLIGRWIADGHIESRGSSFTVSIGNHKLEQFKKIANDFCGAETCLTATQIRLINLSKITRSLLYKCGKGAINKQIPIELLSLNEHQSKILLNGYLSGDGHYLVDRNRWIASTISKKLALELSILAQKAYGAISSVYKGKEPGTTTIEGRTVRTNQDYIVCFDMPNKTRKAFIEKDGAWKKVRSIELSGEAETWCLKVAEDESFHAEGCIVKNCPLQLDVIERAIHLWTNPGDVVFTPFCGIGSEVYSALRTGRKGIGIELNPKYAEHANNFCKQVEAAGTQKELF